MTAKLANIKDTAKALSVSEHFLRCEIKAGRIPVYKSGRKYLFYIELVEQFLKDRCMENVKNEEQLNSCQSGKLKKINL